MAYEKLISVLYSPEDRKKIEWIIGSIIAGDTKAKYKNVVIYGPPATGKSTMLCIVEWLLGCAVIVKHDVDLSRAENDIKIYSIVPVFMATNSTPAKDADTLHRTLYVSPTGNRVEVTEYYALMAQIKRELVKIATHCFKVYKNDKKGEKTWQSKLR